MKVEWEHKGSVRWRGIIEPNYLKTVQSNAPFDIRFKRIVCRIGYELLLHGITINRAQQLVAGPIPLAVFGPLSHVVNIEVDKLEKDESVTVTIHNPTSQILRYDIELIGLR